MVKNHESISTQSEPGTENPWSDLEKMGESGLKMEANSTNVYEEIIQETQQSKAAKLDELSKRIRDTYKATGQQKGQFPDVPISIIISETTFGSCHTPMSIERIQEFANNENWQIVTLKDIEADIPVSGFGDHYIEFGEGNARRAGKRNITSCIEIRM